MIYFHYETDFQLNYENMHVRWIQSVLLSEKRTAGEINFVFCDDKLLLDMNVKHLNHNNLTDVISFDCSNNTQINGDIFISIDRVKDNAQCLDEVFEHELRRVMAHGVLHFCGYNDKSTQEAAAMRKKEGEKIKMFHVEQGLESSF